GIGIAPFCLVRIGKRGNYSGVSQVVIDVSTPSVSSFNLLHENDGLVIITGPIKLVGFGDVLTYSGRRNRSRGAGWFRRERHHRYADEANRERRKDSVPGGSKNAMDHGLDSGVSAASAGRCAHTAAPIALLIAQNKTRDR